jgi:DNA-binding NarL/FixJ family response regulator
MKIFVADDHSLFRDGVISLLEAGGYEVVGQAGDGKTALERIPALHPDLVLLDINMPEMDGLQVLLRIKNSNPEIKVVILTVSEDENHLVDAIQAGADGYLLKHLNSNEFLEMIAGLERGEAAITRSMASRLFKHVGQPVQPKIDQILSERELEVLKLVSVGKTNREVAREMSISENTVKFHLKNIMLKLNVSNRTEAVMVAITRELLKNPTTQ